jgi:hypothetical protein
MNSISYEWEEDGIRRIVTLSIEDVLQRLGSSASTADAEKFARTWNTRFHDSGNPVFYDEDDKTATWQETAELAFG